MASLVDYNLPYVDALPAEHDAMRGRKRHRSMTRVHVKPIRTEESSTLRGRSRQRASSPFTDASRNPSPSLAGSSMTTTTTTATSSHRLYYERRMRRRRDRCPSRAPSAASSKLLGQRHRTRSRSRDLPVGAVADVRTSAMSSGHRPVEGASSGLRNEIRLGEDDKGPESSGGGEQVQQ